MYFGAEHLIGFFTVVPSAQWYSYLGGGEGGERKGEERGRGGERKGEERGRGGERRGEEGRGEEGRGEEGREGKGEGRGE